MTKKATQPDEQAKIYYFPTLALSVKAATEEEARETDEYKTAVKAAEKVEGGDVNS